ncbi:MAG: CoA-binding protein [Nitrososphaeraceae archaeon]
MRRIVKVIGDATKKKGIKVIWMQLAVYNEGAVKKAREYVFDVVFNRFMMEEHKRLFGK